MIGREFLTAGNAIFTVEPASNYIEANLRRDVEVKPHYTFRIQHKPAQNGYRENWFVSLLVGPQNTKDYAYVGLLDAKTGQLVLTRKSPHDESQPIVILKRILACLMAGEGHKIEAAGWKVHHEGRCGKCGRTLTVPSSIESGFGEDCLQSMGLAA